MQFSIALTYEYKSYGNIVLPFQNDTAIYIGRRGAHMPRMGKRRTVKMHAVRGTRMWTGVAE